VSRRDALEKSGSRIDHRGVRVVALAATCSAILAAGSTAAPVGITQRSIGGARVGFILAQYRHLFGGRGLRMDLNSPSAQPTG
jgi:hypothetical protein